MQTVMFWKVLLWTYIRRKQQSLTITLLELLKIINIGLYIDFYENTGKIFWLILTDYQGKSRSNQGKNKDEDETFTENEYDVWISTLKLRYISIFMKVLEKNTWHMFYWFLTNRSKIEDGKEKKLEKQNNF